MVPPGGNREWQPYQTQIKLRRLIYKRVSNSFDNSKAITITWQ
jgi:hypothetical protein